MYVRYQASINWKKMVKCSVNIIDCDAFRNDTTTRNVSGVLQFLTLFSLGMD